MHSQFSSDSTPDTLSTKYNHFDGSQWQRGLTRPPQDTAIDAVNIARLTENPSMLPFALYIRVRGLHTHRAWWTAECGLMVPSSTSLPPGLKLCLRVGARGQRVTKQTALYLKDIFERIWIWGKPSCT